MWVCVPIKTVCLSANGRPNAVHVDFGPLAIMSTNELVFKLVPAADIPEDAWRTRQQWTTAFEKFDDPKFIKLLTAEEVAGAAEKSFAGRADVMLLSFVVELMEQEADLKIKFEADGVKAFGGVIPYACLHSAPAVLKVEDGKHVLPPLGLAAIAAAEKEASGIEHEEDDWEGEDSGHGEHFDQHTFDLDDEDNANYVA